MLRLASLISLWWLCGAPAVVAQPSPHVWELQEVELRASRAYTNPYVDVECWVELKGPGFSQRVYGFWDGGDLFRVRIVSRAEKWGGEMGPGPIFITDGFVIEIGMRNGARPHFHTATRRTIAARSSTSATLSQPTFRTSTQPSVRA